MYDRGHFRGEGTLIWSGAAVREKGGGRLNVGGIA